MFIRGLSLGGKLLASLAGMVLLVLALLMLAERFLGKSAAQIEQVIQHQVRQLGQLNSLQARVSRIRVLEMELPRLSDMFAMSDQLELLTSETSLFDRELDAYLGAADPARAPAQTALREAWLRYRRSLQGSTHLARAMDLEGVNRHGTYESAPRFVAVSRLLKQFTEQTEQAAGAALQEAREAQEQQRRWFMATSIGGLLLLAAWLATLWQHITRRLRHLREGARHLAEARAAEPIPVEGGDELADLARAFNTMQLQVAERQSSLEAARADLELRVQDRTAELAAANQALVREVDVRRQAEVQLHRQARFDPLTGLPNRLLALDRLEQAMLEADRNRQFAVLLFIDLDDFKKVNDSLGHSAGDELLVEAARRLLCAVRLSDTVARLGGDEFVIVLHGVGEAVGSQAVAQKVLTAFARPFKVGAHALFVTPSVGMAVYPGDADDAAGLLRNADLAMYEAKEAGRNTFRFFNLAVRERATQRLAIEEQLRHAQDRGELWLALQPLVHSEDGGLRGAEALLRWRRDGTPIGPERFIPVAEQTGLIVPIGQWVVDQACQILARWRAQGRTGLHLAVNVSPVQFREPGLVPYIIETLRRYDLPAPCLQIEVTEGLLIRNTPEVQAALQTLSELGVRLAMDDFGTGYSSFSYLKRYPFDVLKIDREFVREIDHNRADRALVSAAIHMGRSLGLAVVAEGVETASQRDCLRQAGCELLQGYLFGTPVEPSEFERRWLQSAAV